MEQIIIVCLLLIIILLVVDKKPKSKGSKDRTEDKSKQDYPSIMGNTKREGGHRKTFDDLAGQIHKNEQYSDNFDSETYEKVFDNSNEMIYLDKILVKNENLEEEGEDWRYQVETIIESGFATGVTFEELNTAGQLLQQNVLEPALEKEVVHIIQKVHGTELFSLLEHSLGSASDRIALLLSESISNDVDIISSQCDGGAEGFDIREFV